jgi:hypothetical protein
MQRLLLAIVITALPGVARADLAQDVAPQPTRVADQRMLDQDARVLQQIKASVCGTGPVYVGKVDDPIFVTPRFKPACSLTETPPGAR